MVGFFMVSRMFQTVFHTDIHTSWAMVLSVALSAALQLPLLRPLDVHLYTPSSTLRRNQRCSRKLSRGLDWRPHQFVV